MSTTKYTIPNLELDLRNADRRLSSLEEALALCQNCMAHVSHHTPSHLRLVTEEPAGQATGDASKQRTRPLRLVELDAMPRANWQIDADARYLWNGRVWQVEPVGCVLCVENPEVATLSTTDNVGEAFVCMEHGALCEVPYKLRKVYTIRIGDVVREGEESVEDTMLFPTDMALPQRTALIEKLLDEAANEEAEAGAAPPSE